MSKDPSRLTGQDWLDALDRAEADIAEGRIVPAEEALAHMDRVLDDMSRRRDRSVVVRRR